MKEKTKSEGGIFETVDQEINVRRTVLEATRVKDPNRRLDPRLADSVARAMAVDSGSK